MSDKIDMEVDDFVLERGIIYKAMYEGESLEDGWAYDLWKVTFDDVAFEFKTGLGLRKLEPWGSSAGVFDGGPQPTKGTILYKQWQDTAKPVKPSAASVLHCLLLDYSACDQSFASWCSDFGYDTDSRKALSIYEECQKNADKLKSLFSPDEISTLATLVEEY